jgi:AcrR family transcriptional regulator
LTGWYDCVLIYPMSGSHALKDAGSSHLNAPDKAWKLPRGPHALPQEVVAAHQRERIVAAVAPAMAEKGYAKLTVKDLIDRAGVSRRTFYQLFDDKLDCVFAAHHAAFSRLNSVIVDACASQGEWADGVVAAIDGALAFVAEAPDEARLILISSQASEPKLARRGRASHDQLAALLRSGRNRPQSNGTPLPSVEQAIVGAAMSLVADCLIADELDRLPELGPELVQIVLTPYLGDEAARGAAAGS